MLAEISVTPIDKTTEGFSQYVSQSIDIIQNSGLDYVLTPMGTIIEGDAEKVFDLIKEVHINMAKQSDRVSTSIKIDDRKGKTGAIRSKTESVEKSLGKNINRV